MCLIVEVRQSDTLTFSEVKDWEEANADGWGIAYPYNGVVTVLKGHGLKSLWRAIQEHKGRAYYLHLRMATHGSVKEGNTHPYPVTRGVWLLHNGVLDIDTSTSAARSDTWHWIESVLKPLLDSVPDASAAIRTPWFRAMVELYGGPSNRFVFIDGQGAVTMNDAAWHTFKGRGMRVSNTYALGGWVSKMGTSKYPNTSTGTLSFPQQQTSTFNWNLGGESWELEEDDPTCEDDFRFLIGAEYNQVEDFVYSHPERAADVLHSLVNAED